MIDSKMPIADQSTGLRAGPAGQSTGGNEAAEAAEVPAWKHASFAPGSLGAQVVEALRAVYDPEIPVNIYDLGLIYGVDVREGDAVHVTMTLTSPMCPVAGSLPGEVEECVGAVEGVNAATVELVWDPPWSPELMGEAARLQLNMF